MMLDALAQASLSVPLYLLQGLKPAPLRHRLRRSLNSGAESDGPAAKASCDPRRAPTGRNALEVCENDCGVLLLRNVKLPFRVAERGTSDWQYWIYCLVVSCSKSD